MSSFLIEQNSEITSHNEPRTNKTYALIQIDHMPHYDENSKQLIFYVSFSTKQTDTTDIMAQVLTVTSKSACTQNRHPKGLQAMTSSSLIVEVNCRVRRNIRQQQNRIA